MFGKGLNSEIHINTPILQNMGYYIGVSKEEQAGARLVKNIRGTTRILGEKVLVTDEIIYAFLEVYTSMGASIELKTSALQNPIEIAK